MNQPTRQSRALKYLGILGKTVNAIITVVNLLDLLSSKDNEKLNLLYKFFSEWKNKVGTDNYYEQLKELINSDERLQELLEEHGIEFPPLEVDLNSYIFGDRELRKEQMRLQENENISIKRQPNVSEEGAAALLNYFMELGAESTD